jgi:hypothetical protein
VDRPIDLPHAVAGYLSLPLPQIAFMAQHLTIEVVIAEHIPIYQDQPPNPYASQPLDHVPAQAAQTNHCNARAQKNELTIYPDRSMITQITARQSS